MDIFSKTLADYWFPKAVVAFLGGVLSYLVGNTEANRAAFVSVGVLLTFDTLTGAVAAAQAGKLSSKGFIRVGIKILVYCSIIVVAGETARIIPGLLALRDGAIGVALSAIGVTEAISILENALRLGWNVPEPLRGWIKHRLEDLKKFEPGSIEPPSPPTE